MFLDWILDFNSAYLLCEPGRLVYDPRLPMLMLRPNYGKRVLDATRNRAYRPLFLFVLLGTMGSLFSGEAVTLDFPIKRHELRPGLADYPRESTKGLLGIEVPLLPVETEGSILVSIVFQDDVDRIILVKWVGEGHETVLAANLSEGARAWNRGIVNIPYSLLKGKGSLVLETDAEVQPVRRMTLTWMWPGGVYMASAAHPVEYISDSKTVITEKDLSNRHSGEIPDSWANGIWRASLQEEVESLEDGLQFEIPMKSPKAAIYRAKLLGYPLSATPEIKVNGQALHGISVNVPDLASPGYYKDKGGEMGFAGWREVAVLIPPGMLQSGVNSILIAQRKGGYVKDSCLELSFEEEGSPFDMIEGSSIVVSEVGGTSFPQADILPDIEAPLGEDAPILDSHEDASEFVSPK